MDLFKTLSSLMAPNTRIVITVLPASDGRLTVLTHVEVPDLEDPAAKLIPDFLVKDTPENLDRDFAATIAEPVKKSSDLQTNMKEYEDALKEAEKKRKKAENDKKEAQEKQKEEDENAFNDLVEEAEEQFKKGNWKAASEKYEEASAKADAMKAPYKFTASMKKNMEQAKKKAEESALAPSLFDLEQPEDTEKAA